MLQAALRKVLGDHVVQRGSSLDENRLRFDFAHNGAVDNEELRKVEDIVNAWILEDLPVYCKSMNKTDAINSGATALFGEKYGDIVRTVSVGDDSVSFELCGGTHAASTGQIGLFKILSEIGIGSGIRRIEAITGHKVIEYLNDMDTMLNNAAEKLKCSPCELVEKITEVVTDLKKKNQEIINGKLALAVSQLRQIQKGDDFMYVSEISGYSVNEMRSLNDMMRKRYPSGVNVIINKDADKISIIISVSKDLQSKYNANLLLKKGISVLNGNGGGSTLYAQGGGALSSVSDVKNVIDQIVEAV